MAKTVGKVSMSKARPGLQLPYGHYGRATYDGATSEWHFLRRDHLEHNIAPRQDETFADTITQELPGVVMGPLHQNEYNTRGAAADELATREILPPNNLLLKQIPQGTAIRTISSRALPASHTGISSDGTGHAQMSSNRITFGSALLLNNEYGWSGFTTVPIATMITGVASDRIEFSLIGSETLSVRAENLSRPETIEVPILTTLDAVTWSTTCAIRHLAVSHKQSSQQDTRFAAISERGTSIFQPLLHTTGNSNPLDPNFLIELPCTETGGALHAFVAFHPQNTDQVAVVDVNGVWSTWSLVGKRSKSSRILYRIRLLATGHLDKNRKDSGGSGTAAWHKISWTSTAEGIIDRIFVCNRNSIAIFNLEGMLIHRVEHRQHGDNTRVSILDAIPSNITQSMFFVLTTARILCIDVASTRIIMSDKETSPFVMLGCNHFRGPNDLSLTLHSVSSSTGAWIFLFSRYNTIVTYYRVARALERTFSISNPSLMYSPFNRSEESDSIRLESVQVRRDNFTDSQSMVSFFKIFACKRSGMFEDALFLIKDVERVRGDKSWVLDVLPLPKKDARLRRSERFINTDEVDDFIVNDGETNILPENEDDANGSSSPQNVPKLTSNSLHKLNMRPTYEHLLQSIKDYQSSETSLISFLEHAEEIIFDTAGSSKSLLLLRDLSGSIPFVAEVEDDADHLHTWLTEISKALSSVEEDGQLVVHIAPNQQELLDTYHRLSEDWMSLLPSGVPERTRHAREKIIRQVALEICLSNIVFVRNIAHIDETMGKVTWEDVAPVSQSRMSTHQEESTVTHSVSEHNVTSSLALDCSTLKNFVSFTEPSTVSSTSGAIENILAHLPKTMDVNPDEYSYSNTEATLITAQIDQNHQSLEPKARRKVEKLAKSRRKQLEKQDQLKKSTFDSLTNIPNVMSSQLPIRNIQSSQVPVPSSSQPQPPQISMSQPERGVFGGGEGKKTRKRKTGRHAGF